MDELNQKFTEIILKCLAANPISSTDIETLTNKQMPDNTASMCMFACAYKEIGVVRSLGTSLGVGQTEEASVAGEARDGLYFFVNQG